MTIATDKYYEVTDIDNKTWKEWPSQYWVDQYKSWGWTVKEIKS